LALPVTLRGVEVVTVMDTVALPVRDAESVTVTVAV
jgi:hypothetical protein